MPSLVPRRMPRLDSLVNKRAENEIYQSFQRVYESLESYCKELEAKVDSLSKNLESKIEKQSALVKGFGTQLIQTQNGIATLGEGSVSEINTQTGELTGGPITSSGTIGLENTAVTPANYIVPKFTVDSKGRLTLVEERYLIYTALFTCGNPPILVEHENTIGSIIWSQVGVGDYQGDLTGAFLVSTVWFSALLPIANSAGDVEIVVTMKRLDNNTIQLQIADRGGNLFDSAEPISIEIRVYS